MQATHTGNDAPSLKRSPARQYTQRKTLWYDHVEWILMHEDGQLVEPHPWGTLSEVLVYAAAVRVRVVYVLGGGTVGTLPGRHWFTEPLAEGWTIDSERDSPRAFSYSIPDPDGERSRVDVLATAAWFPDQPNVDRARRAYLALRADLKAAYGPGATILTTATQTGLDLLEQSLPYHREYPTIPEDVRELLYQTQGQGRIELCTPDQLQTVHDVYVLDARWMYAACVSNMPAGPFIHDDDDEYIPHKPGFYHVCTRVPEDWDRVGILPVENDRPEGGRFSYPERPGTTFESWCSGAEVELALQNGWPVHIMERIVWPHDGGDPLRAWADKLRAMRHGAEILAERPASGDDTARLRMGAIRHLMLDPIGAFWRHDRYVKHITPHELGHTVPRDCKRSPEAWGIEWYEPVALTRYHLRYMHPEWAATAWGRCRARTTKAALQLPRERVLAVRTDALVTTVDPSWPDNGKPGAWRVKHSYHGEWPAPHTTADLLKLLTAMKAEEEN